MNRFILILSGLIVLLAGCTTQVPNDPQVYGMPQSQFARLSPEQQQAAMKFHNEYAQADYKSGAAVANQSPDSVTKISTSTKHSKHGKQTTTTITSPTLGNPDLETYASQTPTPVVVKTN